MNNYYFMTEIKVFRAYFRNALHAFVMNKNGQTPVNSIQT